VGAEVFAAVLEASAARALVAQPPDTRAVEGYLRGLHLQDMALASACAAGNEDAWQYFVLTYRPILYRTADAIDPTGGARDLADSLYAELFGLSARGEQRPSLFRYFHGRSTLATWLRAVMSQRHVDRVRERKKTRPLPEDDSATVLHASSPAPDPDRSRFVLLMRNALLAAVRVLAPGDRLRLACYYARQMTLAEVGRLLSEHEATVSRHLARTRVAIRTDVERQLRIDHHLSDAQIAECFKSIADDVGPLDVGDFLGTSTVGGLVADDGSKKSHFDRSPESKR
jgi:RNA polymerase sigma-70 factor (ECF subfamily)